MIGRRRARREAYSRLVADVPGVEVFQRAGDDDDNCWLTALVIDPEIAATDAAGLSAVLREAGIESRPLWKPMHLQPVFAGFPALVNGVSEELFRTGLTLPSGSALTEEECGLVDATLVDVLAVMEPAVRRRAPRHDDPRQHGAGRTCPGPSCARSSTWTRYRLSTRQLTYLRVAWPTSSWRASVLSSLRSRWPWCPPGSS